MTRKLPLLLLCLLGCAAASDEEVANDESELQAPMPKEATACASSSVGKDATGAAVFVCKKTFAEAPFVRLPADALAAHSAKFYGGLTLPSTGEDRAVLWSRDGNRYVPVDAAGTPIKYGEDGATKLPRALHAPTNRSTFTLYEFTGTLGSSVETAYGTATKIRLSAARAVVKVDGCAFDSRLLGTWSGTVSERLARATGPGTWAPAFDEAKRVPIHLTFDTIKKFGSKLMEFSGAGPMPDADSYRLYGAIDNFDKDVTVDGTHYPSLKDMGKKNPFYGAANGKVDLYRLGNMHGLANDGHWVFTYPTGAAPLSGNGMSYTLTAFTAPSMLFGADVDADALQQVEIKPHLPYTTNGHSIVIAPEKIGARSGQCE